MLLILVADVEPHANLRVAMNALRHPDLVVVGLDVGRCDVFASIEAASSEIVYAASERMRTCPGVRSTYVALPEPYA